MNRTSRPREDGLSDSVEPTWLEIKRTLKSTWSKPVNVKIPVRFPMTNSSDPGMIQKTLLPSFTPPIEKVTGEVEKRESTFQSSPLLSPERRIDESSVAISPNTTRLRNISTSPAKPAAVTVVKLTMSVHFKPSCLFVNQSLPNPEAKRVRSTVETFLNKVISAQEVLLVAVKTPKVSTRTNHSLLLASK